MRRTGPGWLVLLFATAFALTWALRTGADRDAPTPVRADAARIASATPVPVAVPVAAPVAAPPGTERNAQGTTAPPRPPDAAAQEPAGGAELERVAAVLAAEPALIDALQDSASHPDPVVRAEAELLVSDALARARSRTDAAATSPSGAVPDAAAP